LKKLSIILPVYNNRDVLKKNLGYLFDYLNKTVLDFELIIVDDGSRDEKEIKNISDSFNCVLLRNGKNLGKGASLKRGMLEAEGKYRIFTDADIPYENESISLMVKKLEMENADVIIGDRTLLKSEYKSGSLLRSVGSSLFSFIVWGITSGKFGDTQCGLKGFTSSSAEKIFGKTKINGFAADVELLYIATKNKLKIEKIPVKLRSQSSSTVSVIRHGFLMLVDLIRIKIYQLRKKYE